MKNHKVIRASLTLVGLMASTAALATPPVTYHVFSYTAPPSDLRSPEVGASLRADGALYFHQYNPVTKTHSWWNSSTGATHRVVVPESKERPVTVYSFAGRDSAVVGSSSYEIHRETRGSVGPCPVPPHDYSVVKRDLKTGKIEREIAILRRHPRPVLIAESDAGLGCPSHITPLPVPESGLYRQINDVEPILVLDKKNPDKLFLVFENIVMRVTPDLRPITTPPSVALLEKSALLKLEATAQGDLTSIFEK